LAFKNNPLLVKAKEEEEVALATFDMDQIREFRKQEQWRLDYKLRFKL
jgi:hypothetical protein